MVSDQKISQCFHYDGLEETARSTEAHGRLTWRALRKGNLETSSAASSFSRSQLLGPAIPSTPVSSVAFSNVTLKFCSLASFCSHLQQRTDGTYRWQLTWGLLLR